MDHPYNRYRKLAQAWGRQRKKDGSRSAEVEANSTYEKMDQLKRSKKQKKNLHSLLIRNMYQASGRQKMKNGSKSAEVEAKSTNKKGKARAQKKVKRTVKNTVVDTINPAPEPASNFLEDAPEDILFEIFLRLPEYRSVVLCGAVCPKWHSVISQPQFVPSYVRNCSSRPYTIIFYETDTHSSITVQHCQPFLNLDCKDSLILRKNKRLNLDFMPSPMIVRASSDDLLLVSPSRYADYYYICNPISRQWVQLPKIDISLSLGFALLRNKPDQYKVVLVSSPSYRSRDRITTISARVFCSSSGQWTRSSFSYPLSRKSIHHFEVITSNGILYWLETELSTCGRIFFFDVFNDQWGIINFPHDLVIDSNDKVHLGLVRGEVRLVEISERYRSCFIIKVWELQHTDTACWILIKEMDLTKPNNNEPRGFAVHPNRDDLFFMIWGRHVFRHSISGDKCVKVTKLASSAKDYYRVVSTTLLHPPLPTPVPLLPSI